MEKKQRFSLRKMKNGVVSVAVGSLLVFAGTIDVEASESEVVKGEEVGTLALLGVNESQPVGEALAEEDPTKEDPTKDQEDLDIDRNPSEGSQEEAPEFEEGVVVDSGGQVKVDTGEVKVEKQDPPKIIRHGGVDREEVAINVAKSEQFKDAKKVIIVNQDMFPDSISATNISQGEFPVLYTRANTLGDKTYEYLSQRSNTLEEIYLLGGTTSIDSTIEDYLVRSFGDIVTRIGGSDRFEANVNTVRERFVGPDQQLILHDHAVIASGEIYTDALYGVSFSSRMGLPMLLSKTDRLVEDTVQLLEDMGIKSVTIIGGKNSVNESVDKQLEDLGIDVERFAGDNRYDGSVVVAEKSFRKPTDIVIASGDIHTDALVSAPLAQSLEAPILLVRRGSTVEEVKAYLKKHSPTIENIYIQGGLNTINQPNQESIQDLSTERIDVPVIIEGATLTINVKDENTVTATFANEEEDYEATQEIELKEELVDGVENKVVFIYNGTQYTVTFLYTSSEKFVKEVDALKYIKDYETMNREEIDAERVNIERVKTLAEGLTRESKDELEVTQRMKSLEKKDTALLEALDKIIDITDDAHAFINRANNILSTYNAEDPPFTGLENLKVEVEGIKVGYEDLTDKDKENPEVKHKLNKLEDFLTVIDSRLASV